LLLSAAGNDNQKIFSLGGELMTTKLFTLAALPAAGFLAALAAMPAQAATVTFDYGVSFGAVSPDGPAPWATSVFDDGGGSGSVTLTMSVAASVNLADVTAMYFNLDPSIDPTSLAFTRDSGTGPTAANTSIQTGTDNFQADGDGQYDILFDFPPPPGQQDARFNAGEDLVYTITGPGITANSFNFFATPAGEFGPYLSVARFQDTGPLQEDSDWVGAVPVPAAVWLFGSGLLGLVGIARRKRQ
jgi:hypothetical protein